MADVRKTPLFLDRHSLKTRITLITLVIFVLGIWSLAFYTSRMLRVDIQHLLGEQQLSTVSFVADAINDELTVRLRALERYSDGRITPAILGDAAAMQARLEGSPTLLSMFNGGIWVARQDGVALASVPPGRIGTSFNDRDYMRVALREGKSIIL